MLLQSCSRSKGPVRIFLVLLYRAGKNAMVGLPDESQQIPASSKFSSVSESQFFTCGFCSACAATQYLGPDAR